jgi:hypothetical protein
MLSKDEEPSGWNRYEGIAQVISLIKGNERTAKIQWYASDIPMFQCTDTSDEEWDLLEKAFKADKRIMIASKNHITEKFRNFHNCYMEILY